MNFTCLDFYNDKLARALILKSAMACCMQAVGSHVLAEILFLSGLLEASVTTSSAP